MKPKILIRLAAACIAFFTIGHSMGHFTRYDVTDVNEKQVLQVMHDTKFDLFGQTTTYDGMYTGMSLDLIFTLIAFTFMLWKISTISTTNRTTAFRLLLPMTVCIFGFGITSFVYFFPVPAITCAVAGILLTWALVKLRSVKEVHSKQKQIIDETVSV